MAYNWHQRMFEDFIERAGFDERTREACRNSTWCGPIHEWVGPMRHKPAGTIDARQIAACRKHFPVTDRITTVYEFAPGVWSRPEPCEMHVPYTDFIRFGTARFEDEVRRMMQAVVTPVPISEGSVERIGDGTDGHIVFRWTPA